VSIINSLILLRKKKGNKCGPFLPQYEYLFCAFVYNTEVTKLWGAFPRGAVGPVGRGELFA
jgi:hypothetical protein